MFIITGLIMLVIALLLLYLLYKLFKAIRTGNQPQNLGISIVLIFVPLIINIIFLLTKVENRDTMMIQFSLVIIFIIGFSIMNNFSFENYVTTITYYYITSAVSLLLFENIHLGLTLSIFFGFIPFAISILYGNFTANKEFFKGKRIERKKKNGNKHN